jgi:hypothetical protein
MASIASRSVKFVSESAEKTGDLGDTAPTVSSSVLDRYAACFPGSDCFGMTRNVALRIQGQTVGHCEHFFFISCKFAIYSTN